VTNTFAELNVVGQPLARRPYTEHVQPLIPDAVGDAKYAQLYFYDPDEALDIRMQRNDKLN
jgi:hypothetical protein